MANNCRAAVSLPWPPTVNKYYGVTKTGIRYKHSDVRLFEQEADLIIHSSSHKPSEPMQGPVRVVIMFHPKTNIRRDMDNGVKAVMDALVRNGILVDDCAPIVQKIELIWCGVPVEGMGGHVNVLVHDAAKGEVS